MVSFLAEVKISMNYKAFWPKLRSFFVVLYSLLEGAMKLKFVPICSVRS